MAIRACNNPPITSSILSREITKLLMERAKAVVADILQKRKADAADLLVTLSTGKGEEEGSKRKRHAVSHDSTVNNISPLPNEMYGDEYDSSAASPYPQPRFSAPYLKGKPTQFEGKVKERITALLALSNSPSPAPVPKTAVVFRTRRTNLQTNTQ